MMKFVNDFLDILLSSNTLLDAANIALKFGKAIVRTTWLITNTQMESSLIISNLNPSTVDLLDEIVQLVPRGSHSFLALFNAYNQVLDAHGIDQNDEVEVYDLLLKLGVVKGRDWHERWQAIVNADYDTGFSGVFNQDQDQDVETSSSSSGSASNTNSDTRSTSTAALAAEARETDKEYPPIQYKQHYRDPFTVQARAMASVQAQTNRVRQAESARRREEQERLKRTEDARRRELNEVRQRADENKVLREMESIADTFYYQNIVTRTFKVWLGIFRWIQHNNTQVEIVQKSRILSMYFQRWQYTMNKHVVVASHVAISQDNMRVMSDTLKLWKSRLRHRARHRKEARLRTTYATIRKSIARRLLEEAWQTWRDVTVTRRADVRYSYNVMSKAFRLWKHRTIDVLEKDNVVVEFATVANERRAAAFFDHWRHCTVLQLREKQIKEVASASLLRKYFDIWKNRNDTSKASVAWQNASSVRNAFYAWQRKLYKIQKYNLISDTFAEDRNNRIKRQVIHQWHLSLKCFNFQLTHMHTLGQLVLQYWYNKMQDTQEREILAEEFYFVRIRSLGVSLFEKWKQRTAELREKNHLAIEFRNVNTQHATLKKWMRNYKNKRLLNRRGYVLRRMIQKKNAFYAWRLALNRRRQNEWIRRRDLAIKNDSWNEWRKKYSVLCDLKARESKFKAEQTHKSLASGVLQRWLQKTIDRRDMMYSADYVVEQKMKRSVLLQWRRKSVAVKSLYGVAEAYRSEKDEYTRNVVFGKWLKQTRATVLRNKKCEEFTKQREKRILMNAFEDWYDQIKIIELEPVETEMLILRRVRMLRGALTKWMATSTTLPAVRFYNDNLKARTLRTWNAQLPCARNTRLAMQISRRDVLYKWFIMWRDNLQVKRSRRAIARARALGKRPSATRLKQVAARASATPSPEMAVRRPFSKVNRLY